MLLLGTLLLNKNHISKPQLEQALAIQSKSGGRVGDILVASGAIGYLDLYKALAEKHGLPFVNLLEEKSDRHLLAALPAEVLLEKRVLPWRRDKSGAITVALCDPSGEIMGWCRRQFGEQTQFVLTSPLDIRRTIEASFGMALEKSSRLGLWQKFPAISARITLYARQKQAWYGLLLIMLPLFALLPMQMGFVFLMLCHLAFLAMMLFKLTIFAAGIPTEARSKWNEKLAALDERSLPVYTILIPMYKEAESLPGMLQSMQRMDYPASKLDIKLVLEADDKETLLAAQALKPAYHFDIIRVPPNELRTKPKACNYALRYARGELITVYDADDRPERTQLKKAVIAFRESPDDVACLQARLNYYNANDNLLTRFFSLEYTILFHYMLYGLQRLGIPIPLGGTSNHMSVARLREVGEWDPYNVTEDADLGTRLGARGLKTRMLDSYTMEEAPNRIVPWIRQRSRWIKGYMQTWLVHMRHPARLYETLGTRGFFGFQFFVGLSCFTFLIAPVIWIVSFFWLASPAALFPMWMLWVAAINLTVNLMVHWYMSLYTALQYRKYVVPVAVAAVLYPFYLLLHSVASYKALWQLFVKPHFWEKTTHGLSRHIDPLALEKDVVKTRAQA